jgi:hypothetical protein
MDERNSSRFMGFDEFKPFNRFARFQLLRPFSRKEVFGARRCFVLLPTQLTELKWYRCFCLDFEITRVLLATKLHGRIG